MSFVEFLTDTLECFGNFKNDVSTIYVDFRDGAIFATANHVNRLLFCEATPLDDFSGQIEGPIFLGALPYLQSLLGSRLMKEAPELEISYVERNGRKVASSILFKAKKLEAIFECTNPEILNEKDRVRQFPRLPDSIFFPLTKETRKCFDEVARFSTPKSDNRLFTLHYDGKQVRAVFGSGKNVTRIVLNDQVTGNTQQTIQRLVSLDRFRAMIKLASEYEGKAGFHNNAVWVDFTTKIAIHTIATPTIRDQGR